MIFQSIFKVQQVVVEEAKEMENMIVNDIVDTALKVRDKTISDVTGMFDTIVNTIEHDIKALEDGLASIEHSLFELSTKKISLETDKATITAHQEDLTKKLDAVKIAISSISDKVKDDTKVVLTETDNAPVPTHLSDGTTN